MSAVTITGNITADPDLRFTPNGAAVVTLGVAVNRNRRQGDEWVEETSFFDVDVWQQQAENVAASLHKGDRVVVSGRLEQQRWENDQGERRSKVHIIADEIGVALRWATVSGVEKNQRASDPAKEAVASARDAGFVDDPF